MKKTALILTCEHGGYHLPEPWACRVNIPEKVLKSHRGWDPGASELACNLKKAGVCSLWTHEISRLLIELNRSEKHPKLFSEYSIKLPLEKRREIFRSIYLPYRSKVAADIRSKCQRGKRAIHISVHSFTPILKGEKRRAEVGILYDPSREGEKLFATAWQQLLKTNLGGDYRVRLNYPYRGISDGFTTTLRRSFADDQYLGIELEVNQALYSNAERWKLLSSVLTKTLSLLLKRGG